MRQGRDCAGRPTRAWWFAALAGIMLVTGCAVQSVKSQAFSRLDRLESGFERGVSTKADVISVLGEPDGSGGSRFPTAAHDNEVWYYEASRASLSSVTQKILLVYFRGGVFDGFMWFTNDADISMQ